MNPYEARAALEVEQRHRRLVAATNPYAARAQAELERRRFRAKIDDFDAIATVVFGASAVEVDDDEPTRPRRDHLELAYDGALTDEPVAGIGGEDSPITGFGDDEVTERPSGFHRGELALWEAPLSSAANVLVSVGQGRVPMFGRRPDVAVTIDVNQRGQQFESVPWSDGDKSGKHRVLVLEEWRERLVVDHKAGTARWVQRTPNPPQWCSVFAAERVDGRCGYIGCHEPLPLDWPAPVCEFPYQPATWWRGDRPAYCHCNGCMTHPKSHGRRYCADHGRTIEYAKIRRDRRREGKSPRGNRSAIDRAADKRVRNLKCVTEL